MASAVRAGTRTVSIIHVTTAKGITGTHAIPLAVPILARVVREVIRDTIVRVVLDDTIVRASESVATVQVIPHILPVHHTVAVVGRIDDTHVIHIAVVAERIGDIHSIHIAAAIDDETTIVAIHGIRSSTHMPRSAVQVQDVT